MIYILGIITGLILGVVAFLAVYIATSKAGPKLEPRIKQTLSAFKPKGSILEPEDEQLTQWIESLPQQNESNTTQ